MVNVPPLFSQLPLVSALPRIQHQLEQGGNLLLTAPTGTGKSSVLPWLLANGSSRVAVLQPRRVAALSLAQFLARAYQQEPGQTVGYRFHLESCLSTQTQILFQTYGSFLQACLHGHDTPWDWVVFDEFHERRSEMDLLMSYLLKWQQVAPHSAPRIAVLSAELNREFLENWLQVPCITIENPGHPVQIIRQEPKMQEPLPAQVVRALRNLRSNQVWHTTLVFLPGKGEIQQCSNAFHESFGHEAPQGLHLFGGQDLQEQKKIFTSTLEPRVIFTTNIAETSLTIPNVTAVIDSGLERSTDYNPQQNMPILRLGRISMQNAIQRTGRAGRTQPGVCIRLWGEREEPSFPLEIIPETLRSKPDILFLHRAALAHQLQLPGTALRLPTEPPSPLAQQVQQELQNGGLLHHNQSITPQGLAVLQVPVQSIELATLLVNTPHPPDLLLACTVILDADSASVSREPRSLLECAQELLEQARQVPKDWPKQLQRLKKWRQNTLQGASPSAESQQLYTQRALFKAFPQALAIQDGAGKSYKLNESISLVLNPAQTGQAPAILAFQLLRSGSQKNQQVRASLFVPVPPEFLQNEDSTVHYELIWRSGQERYTGLRIRTSQGREIERQELIPQECNQAELQSLTQITASTWLERFQREDLSHLWRSESVNRLLYKMQLAAQKFPEYGFPQWDSTDWELVMSEFVDGVFLLRDLNESRFQRMIEDYFGQSMLSWLHKTFPDHYKLQNGKSARYTYYADGLVELSARIADFLGMQGEHAIAENRIQVRYDILAPNYRTVQKTWDLTGFWKNTYPEVRKELRGRYPRHPWPENP